MSSPAIEDGTPSERAEYERELAARLAALLVAGYKRRYAASDHGKDERPRGAPEADTAA